MTNNQMTVEITHGIPEAMRTSAAALYDDAFGSKFAVAISSRRQRLALLAASLNLEFAFGATENNCLIGLAGYKTHEGSFTDGMTYDALLKHAGPIRGNWAALVFSLYERSLSTGQLLMDGVVVDAPMRGRGVGTRLLNTMTSFAKSKGYDAVRLDVIDTNTNARRMYERNGFKATRKLWLLTLVARIQGINNDGARNRGSGKNMMCAKPGLCKLPF